MFPLLTSIAIFVSLLLGAMIGARLRVYLPQDHVSSDARDSVKLSMGTIATMSAMLLGLLVASAKNSYDTDRTEVAQLASKVVFLDRVLAMYGPESGEARRELRAGVEEAIAHMWPGVLSEKNVDLAPDRKTGDAFYESLELLSPKDDLHRDLKSHALSLSMDIGQLRSLLVAQSTSSILKPLLFILVSWLFVTFIGFGILAPSNHTTKLSFVCCSFCIAGALFLIMELDHPFRGLIRISSEPMVKSLTVLEKTP